MHKERVADSPLTEMAYSRRYIQRGEEGKHTPVTHSCFEPPTHCDGGESFIAAAGRTKYTLGP